MHFTLEAQNRCRLNIPESSIAIDATAGNGFDTLFLAQCVGAQGRVLAMDIQADAILRTEWRVKQAGYSEHVECILADHAQLGLHVPRDYYGRVSCAMFNLGYLPHSDKSIVTKAHSTIEALNALEPMLAPDAIVSILVYVGHQDGLAESLAVHDWITERSERYQIERLVDLENPSSPNLWLLRNR